MWAHSASSRGERARLRRQARDWLTADLAAWEKLITERPQERAQVQTTLRHWNAHRDLAGIRDDEGWPRCRRKNRTPAACCGRRWTRFCGRHTRTDERES